MPYIRKKKDLKERDLGSKYVIYDYKKGIHLELNETAALIWKLMNEAESLEEVCRKYAEFYDIGYQVACNDVKEILEGLKQKGIVEEMNGDV